MPPFCNKILSFYKNRAHTTNLVVSRNCRDKKKTGQARVGHPRRGFRTVVRHKKLIKYVLEYAYQALPSDTSLELTALILNFASFLRLLFFRIKPKSIVFRFFPKLVVLVDGRCQILIILG